MGRRRRSRARRPLILVSGATVADVVETFRHEVAHHWLAAPCLPSLLARTAREQGRRLRPRPAAGFDLEGLERLGPTSTGLSIGSWPRGARRMTRNTTGELTCLCYHEPFESAQGRRGGVVDAIDGKRRPSFGNGPRRRALTRGRRRSLKRKQAGVPDQVLAAMAFVFSRGALTLRLRGNCAGNACLPCRVSRMAIIDARAVM
jgi:hypothetical protein